MSKIRMNINGREITTISGKTILQAAEENGIEIPHLCYDDRMKPYGACGLCVVEMEGSPKLVRACATYVQDGQVIITDTDRTITARKTALKLLASDHQGDCRPPCMLACPANTDCQGYVGLIANGQFEEALELIKEKIPVPASIGKICPHPCETACRRALVEEPISIAALKGFVGEMDLQGEKYIPQVKESTGKKVAVVGAGPAGLAAAFFLRKEGHQVAVYEAMPHPGGMLRYGIPQYRLDKQMLDAEVELIRKMGVDFHYNTKVGTDISLDHLQQRNDAVFLGIGSWESQGLRCKGDDMAGVVGGIDFLREVTMNNTVTLGGKVLVVGGGNTAMDVARTAVRLGAEEVTVVYRRTLDEMPADRLEIDEAMEEGVKFQFLVAPTEVIGKDGVASGLKCEVMKLGEADASGRRKPEPTGEIMELKADRIIAAIGQKTVIGSIGGINTDKSGNIVVDEGTFQTNMDKVFAGGDAVTGPKIAIDAIAQGKFAAGVMQSYLEGNLVPHVQPPYITIKDMKAEDLADRPKVSRVHHRVVEPEVRRRSFMQVAHTYTAEEAVAESKRCLECGCMDYFECQLIKYIHQYGVETEKKDGAEAHKRKQVEDHPFVARNADKCVLCGLCVRVCDEVVGATAIGLVDRGFESVIQPEFGLPLTETSCISCGQCVDICPTGACLEKLSSDKQVPVDLDRQEGVCGYCGIGCNIFVESKGDMVFRVTPDKTKEEGLLCKRGKFGLRYINDLSRITSPVIRRKDQLVTASWDEAELEVVKGLQAVAASYGKDSIGIVASPRLSNEELFVAGKIAAALNTEVKASYTVNGGSGLADVMGYDASTNSYEEIPGSDFVLKVGDIAGNHPVLDFKLRLAEVPQQQWSKAFANTKDVKAFIKALWDMGAVDEKAAARKVNGYEELKAAVASVSVPEEIKALAERYAKAKKPMIVIDEDVVSQDGVKLLASAAVLTGKVGAAYRGVLLARTKNNSQGAVDMGFLTSSDKLRQGVESGKIKALLVIGENPAVCEKNRALLQKLSFLAVYDTFLTETAELAQVVLPLAGNVESEGTYTRSDRKVQAVYASIPSATGKENLEALTDVLKYFGVRYDSIGQVREAISREVAPYAGLHVADFDESEVYWPNTQDDYRGKHVLYIDGFATADKKATVAAPQDGPLFLEKKVYDTIELYFQRMEKIS